MPKIVLVNTVCTGSHGRLMRDLRRTAEAAGFETTAAFGRGPENGPGCLRIGAQKDVLAHVALTRLFDRHARGSKGATRAFVRALSGLKPDLLHLHNLHGYYLHVETLFAYLRESGVPALWTLHDCWALTGHCSHFVRASCDRWKTGCHDCPLRRAYPASYGLDASRANWAWKKAAFTGIDSLLIASPSQWLSDVVGASYLKDARRVTIPNGVDLNLFTPAAERAAEDRHGAGKGQALLMAVAKPFDERKGFSDALALSQKLQGRAKIMLVGLSGRQLRGLPENVIGLPPTDGPEKLVALYRAADCLINPTYEDTYPTVNMEAMACGTPVAAYAVGGCPEQLAEPVGQTVPCGDADALAKAAMALAEQKSALSAACRAHAVARFDREKALQAYLSQYRMMTGAR